MLSGILSPAFLQSACAHAHEVEPTVITLKALQADPTITSITCVGDISIVATKSGVETTVTKSDLTAEALLIEADDQSTITITGDDVTINDLGSQVEIVTE